MLSVTTKAILQVTPSLFVKTRHDAEVWWTKQPIIPHSGLIITQCVVKVGSSNLNAKYTNPARGIPDFCKQKLLAPPLEPSSHLGYYNHSE